MNINDLRLSCVSVGHCAVLARLLSIHKERAEDGVDEDATLNLVGNIFTGAFSAYRASVAGDKQGQINGLKMVVSLVTNDNPRMSKLDREGQQSLFELEVILNKLERINQNPAT